MGRICIGVAALATVAVMSGCSMGPGTIPRDRFDYGDAISASWKQQTLLNIVKLRYLDPPTFLAVDRVINQYNLQGTFRASGNILRDGLLGQTFNIGGDTQYYDRPTITYAPRKGEKFTKDILTPVPPEGVLALTQSGWKPSVLFRLTVESINGITQTLRDEEGRRIENPDFEQLVADLDALQELQILSIRLVRKGSSKSLMMIFGVNGRMQVAKQRLDRIYDALRLNPDARQFAVLFGPLNRNDGEIAIQTRSIFGMMTGLSGYVEVPQKHREMGWTSPGVQDTGEATDGQLSFMIHSGKMAPANTFAKVRYEGHWFWIDKGDLNSKRLLAALMMVATVAESPSSTIPPFLTIPAGG